MTGVNQSQRGDHEDAAVPVAPNWLKLALVFILYFVGAKLGVVLTVMPEGMAIIWPPNSVLLAALIRFRGTRFWELAALAITAEAAADWSHFTLLESLLFGLINVAEATFAYTLLKRWDFDPRFSSPADLSKFVLAAPLAGALVAALLGAAVYSLFRGTETSYAEFVRIWWFGDALGLLILTPLLLELPPFRSDSYSAPFQLTRNDAALLAGAVAALVLFWASPDVIVFRGHFGPLLLLLPFVLYIAARYPQRWVAASVAVATIILVAATTRGKSPFGPLAPRDAVIRAQEFILVMSLMALGLASLLTQVRTRSRELESANRKLRALNDELEVRVERRTADLSRANEQLATLVRIDPLTGLHNRRSLIEVAQREISHSRRRGRSLALMMIDLDHFKTVNDRYGHLAGDDALKHCASVLSKTIRPGDTCGRYGGEEFAVLAPETDLAGATALAKRIVEVVRETPVPTPVGMLNVTVSIGITTLASQDTGLNDALRRADAALYKAKLAGRNCVAAVAPDTERT